MATFLPENVAFDKMSYFDSVADKIHQTFECLIDQLIARRDALLQRVHELQEEYGNKETTRVAAIEELKRVQQQMQDMTIKVNPNLEFHKQAKQAYQQGMKTLEPSATFLCPVFRCQRKDTMRQIISELVEIVTYEIPDYSLKEEPVLTAGKFGSGANELDTPIGIAFDETTELMYIADCWNSRIQIVSQKGEFVTQFRNIKLKSPWGIAVDKEFIFVTDIWNHALFQFRKKDFIFINKTGTKGNEKGHLDNPYGLCIDTNGDVLVADSDNDRLSVFSKHLKFSYCIGIGQLCRPQDVKLSAVGIVVLDKSPKCVRFLSREGHLLSSCVSRGDTPDCLVASPSFFCLDAADNIIIGDWEYHAIRIFTQAGHLIHTLGRQGGGRGEFISPYGICVTKLGAICVVSNNPNYPLQCF